jgi:multiple sugar transport system substrate-binding protein
MLLALLGAGCSSRIPVTQKTYDGLVLKVACPEWAPVNIIAAQAKVWGFQTGARVDIVPIATTGEKADYPSADLWLIPAVELAHWAAAGQLREVPSEYLNPDGPYAWRDLLPLYRNKLLLWNQRVFALPCLGEAPLCYYRQDIFLDAGHLAAYEAKFGRTLRPPATWDDLVDIAEFFRERLSTARGAEARGSDARGADATPLAGLAPLPANDEGLDLEFYSIAAPFDRRAIGEDERQRPPVEEMFSFHYDLESGEPRIERPAFVEALRLMQRMQTCRPRKCVLEPPAVFRDGEAILTLAGSSWIGRFQAEGSKVRDRFGFCRVPGSRRYYSYSSGRVVPLSETSFVPYLGSGALLGVVPRQAENSLAAFAFLADLSGPKMSAELVLSPDWSAGVCRHGHFQYFTAGAWGLDGRQTAALAETLRQTLSPPAINPVLCLRIPEQSSYRRATAHAIRTALQQGNADPSQVLHTIRDRWRQLESSRGPQKLLAEYRLSLGLTPESKE